MTLQEAIDWASVHVNTETYGIQVDVTLSMHDDAGSVLVGGAFGQSECSV